MDLTLNNNKKDSASQITLLKKKIDEQLEAMLKKRKNIDNEKIVHKTSHRKTKTGKVDSDFVHRGSDNFVTKIKINENKEDPHKGLDFEIAIAGNL